jgi:TonB-linked SusC/RagA family outer membrane protein
MKFCFRKIGFIIICFLFSYASSAQIKKISGKVTSSDGSALPGVSVTVSGKTAGTATDAEGNYSIDAAPGAVLSFSSVGFEEQKVTVGSSSTVNVSLKAGAADKLNEVVVVGYGTQSRRSLTGSVASLDQNVLKSSPNSNLGTALQGMLPGLRVQQSTGQPGTTPSISFRGGSNFNGTGSPLIVVDGIVLPTLFGINMDDVASVDLLKDAGSLAIYGARAANGVLLITTKTGKKGKTQINYSYKNTTNFIRYNSENYLTAAQYIHWNRIGLQSRWLADVADGNTNAANTDKGQNVGSWGWAVNNGWTSPTGLYTTQILSNINRGMIGKPGWNTLIDPNPFVSGQMDTILYHDLPVRTREDMILQQTTTQEHYLNFSGANDQGGFALGLGVLDDNGMVIGSQLKRLSMNFNGSLNVSKRFKVTTTFSGYTLNQKLPYVDPAGGAAGGLMQRFVGVAPTVRYYNDTSGAILPGPNDNTLGNPDYWSKIPINNTNQQRLMGSVHLDYTILPWLKFLATGSGYLLYQNGNNFNTGYQQGNNGAINTTRSASFSNYNDVSYTYNAFLQFNKTFNDVHDVTVLAGGEFYDFKEHTFTGSASGAPTDLFPWLSASVPPAVVNGTITNPQRAYSSFNAWERLASVIGRINYSYKDKYFVTGNLRYDGTSRLANNRYGLFSGISGGWNIQNEDFFQNSNLSKYISVLKPRISWGQVGNLASLVNSDQSQNYYAADQTYPSTSVYNGLGGTYYPNYINTDLKWETATTSNFGADIGLFHNRVSIIADYYIKNIFNKISGLPLDVTSGFSSIQYYNNGQLQNKGYEVSVTGRVLQPVNPGGLSIDVSANISHVTSYVIKLPFNGLPGNRQGTMQVWDPKNPTQLIQVGGLVEGQRVGLDAVYAPKYDGIYTSQSQLDKDANVYNAFLPYIHKNLKQLGDAVWQQVNPNDTIDSRQFVYVGRTTPQFTGGFSANISYKGFSLYGQFDFATGFVILNNEKLRGLSQVQGSQNSTVDVLNTWAPDNTSGTLPRFYWANQGRNYATDASGNNPPANFWERGDYLMAREVTLSYDINQKILKQSLNNFIKGARFYITGNNLAYFTKYSGNFPEVGGVDNGKFPLPRRLTLGVNVNL